MISRCYYTEGRIHLAAGPLDATTDLLYCTLVPGGQLAFEPGVVSAQQNKCYREFHNNDYCFEIETAGIRTAQYLNYPIVITIRMIQIVHDDFGYKYNTMMRNVYFSDNPKPPLTPDMLMYLHFEWFKLLRAAYEEEILEAAGLTEEEDRIPRLLIGRESQECFRRRIQMRRNGRFPPLTDEPWPVTAHATTL